MSARATEPPRFDDWRTRMAVRGGPVTHAVARAGWAAFGIVGALLMVGVAVLWTLNPTAEGSDNAPAANFVGGLVVFVPIGALVAGAIGLGAQFLARAWLRTPTDAERTAAREAATPAPHAGRLRSSGRWARSFDRCARSVTSFHAIVAALPAGPGRDWLTGIGTSLDEELREALRLAELGESLAPDGGYLTGTALRIADLLDKAEQAFRDTTDRAGAIALDLRQESDFERVRAQLDMLAAQTPHLRTHGL
ncbi:hypothetical protein ACFS2C_22665 [Prauserella oleivorans]|uniref:Uncharacterized protein n=1 Tax=Prauserella oleivorans TaxID=1478153 RepID=A0ABW5WEM2_9PSEU